MEDDARPSTESHRSSLSVTRAHKGSRVEENLAQATPAVVRHLRVADLGVALRLHYWRDHARGSRARGARRADRHRSVGDDTDGSDAGLVERVEFEERRRHVLVE